MEDKKELLLTTESQAQDPEKEPVATTAATVEQPGADNVEEAIEATATDKVVDDWFLSIRKTLSRDTATRNVIYRGLSDLKTALNEVKA